MIISQRFRPAAGSTPDMTTYHAEQATMPNAEHDDGDQDQSARLTARVNENVQDRDRATADLVEVLD